MNPETQRILGAPVEVFTSEETQGFADKWTALLQRRKVRNEMPLWPIQGEALEVMHRWLTHPNAPDFPYGPLGQLDPIGVGHGKTLISFLLAEVVRRVRGDVTPMVLVPAPLVGKTRVAHGRASRYYRYPVPDIVSMSVVSHMNHSAVFEKHRPDLIVIDESHQFGDKSTRTKRLQRWVSENPETIVVSMSGTLTDKSITNYQHLAELALRHWTPIPDEDVDVELWQSVLDVGGKPTRNARKAFMKVVNFHREQVGEPRVTKPDEVTQEVARQAFQFRLRSLPGVVGTDDASCKASLVIRPWRVELPPEWNEAADEFTDSGMWEMPGGEEVVDALAASRARGQLSSGYYTKWVWPERDCPGHWDGARFHGCTANLRCLCGGSGRWAGEDYEWLHHRRVWAARERHTLAAVEQKTGQDSPALIRDLALAGKLGAPAKRELEAWLEMRPRYYDNGRVEPPTVAVDLDPGPEWLAQLAKAWAAKNRRGIIWYATPRVGRALGAAGFPVFGRGTDLGHENPRSLRHPVVAAKIDVQGTGKNMQLTETGNRPKGWNRNLALEFRGSGRRWEQKLGRNHRPGTVADEVYWDVLVDGGHRSEMFASAKIGAKYIQSTTGSKQRLCYATYLPPIEGKYVAIAP